MHALRERLAKFEEIVSPNFCYELARNTQLIQRSTSKLKGYEFAHALMIPNGFLEAESLNSLAVRMRKLNNNCNISASALAQRINTKGAERFMRVCFGKVLSEIVKKDMTDLSDLPILAVFNRVLIEDSTKAELHKKLSPYFKGNGGVASIASVKIDYIFDYLTEEIVDVGFFSGNEPDQALAGRITSFLEKDDLVLRDLGYYALDKVKEIEKKEAFYISRLPPHVVVYDNKEATEACDLARLLDQKMGQGIVDIDIFIGPGRHPARLVACRMSDDAINKRNRLANRSAQRHGTAMSRKKKSLLKYCTFITNVTPTMLSSTIVMAIYRARWRVELIFKQWKSCLKVHMFKGYNKERFNVFLYGRLIMVLLLGVISPPFMLCAKNFERELSTFKLTNYLIADHAFPKALLENKLDEFIDQLLQDMPRRLCKDKRNRASLRSNVRNGKSYYNEAESIELLTSVA